MRNVGTNSDVVRAFVKREEGPNRNNHRSISHCDGVLYSYSTPIARWVADKYGVAYCLFNVDTYSPTTNQHQSAARHALYNHSRADVSLSCLRQHDISFEYSDVMVLDITEDTYEGVYEDQEGFDTFERRIRDEHGALGELRYSKKHGYKSYHLAGGSLIRAKDKIIWSSIDQTQYFACQVTGNPVTIHETMRLLRPEPIRDRGDVLRQGEFFFAPYEGVPPAEMVQKWVRLSDMKQQKYPVNCGRLSWGRRRQDRQSGHHTAQYCVPGYGPGDVPLVSGKIKDGQHGLLDLGKGWYEAYHNTQVISYSADMRID